MENKWMIWILIINTCLALVYFLYRGVWKKEYRKAVLLTVFMILTPVVGPIFLSCSEILNFILFHKRDGLLNEEELSFSKKRVRMIIGDDIEKEIDRVPIEEALMISDTMNRSQLFLEVLKRPDVEEYMGGIHNAMAQEDSEVVHYAASYITDTIAKYKDTEKRLRTIYEESKESDTLLLYLQFCDNMLHKKVFSEPEQKIYLNFFEGYMEELYQKDKTKVNGNMLADIIELRNEYQDAGGIEKWVKRAEDIMEQDLAAAKEVLKYYFKIRNRSGFSEAVRRIKESSLVLDGELLEWVRFYPSDGWGAQSSDTMAQEAHHGTGIPGRTRKNRQGGR